MDSFSGMCYLKFFCNIEKEDILVKRKNIGTCALCKKEDVELRNSHIIPKLAYKKIRFYENSRFRNFYDINNIY